MKDQQLRSTVSWKLGMKMIRLRQAPNPKALSPSERVACLPNIPFSFLVWHLNDLFDTKPQFIVDIRWFVTSAKNPSHSKPTMQSTASCGEILHPPVPQAKPKTKVPATVRSAIQRQRPKRKKRKKRIRRQVCHLWGCSMCGLMLGDGSAFMSSTPHNGVTKCQMHFRCRRRHPKRMCRRKLMRTKKKQRRQNHN